MAVELESRRGQIAIIHFFATWCEPCREELPALQRLASRMDPQPVTVLAISVGEDELRVRRFFRSTPVSFPILIDRDRTVAKAWDISMLPSTIILDSSLRPRLAIESDAPWDQLNPRTLVEMIGRDSINHHASPTN